MSLAGEIRKVATRYPDSKSAILPALRLAQEGFRVTVLEQPDETEPGADSSAE